MSYQRVIPRDFFNEAKLLKCLGKLSLMVLDGMLHDCEAEDMLMEGEQFRIELSDDGRLFCANYSLTIRGEEVELYTPYNSKRNYPLLFLSETEDPNDVFCEDGSLSPEFINFLSPSFFLSWEQSDLREKKEGKP